MSRTLGFSILAMTILLVAGSAAALILRTLSSGTPALNSEALLHEARLKLARGDDRAAEKLAVQAAEAKSPSPWALLVAAEAALKSDRFADALAYYQRTPRQQPDVADSADFGEAEMLCHLGQISNSEKLLRKLLVRRPGHNLAHFRMAFLLNITGRRWEAKTHQLYLVKQQAADIEQLLMLGNPQRQIESRSLLKATAELDPGDVLPKLGEARLELTLNHPSEAKRLLTAVLTESPHEVEAQVRWGQLLLEESQSNQFIEWSAHLSADVERHPDAWMLRGQFAQQRNEPLTALRCYGEALRREPEHHAACHQMGRILTELNEPAQAVPFLERAELLQRLNVVLDDLFHHREHLESMRRVALLTGELGRYWEAASWANIAVSKDPSLQWPRQLLKEILPHLAPDLPQTIPDRDPTRNLDLSRYPLPNWKVSTKSSPAPAAIAESNESMQEKDIAPGIRFKDVARELGIEFQYENAADDRTPGARLFETTGGGVAAVDYDLDGWPDLYLTQGTRNTDLRPDSAWCDRLFRNADSRFEDITRAAGLGDIDFSQGVAVGDYDNDGHPDLYVANMGQNRLYQNQGDGTFRDVTETAGLTDRLWTTSCLVADLNGDGLPDLYDVNYVSGETLLTRICEKQGVIRSCSPRAFDPAPDRLWLNLGDGRFQNVTPDCGVDVPNGNGLGIVALDLDGSGRLSLFVANDEVPNFLFVNETRQPGGALRFDEQALLSGVALDSDGRTQACMGVGAGDADGDGLIDLFVTNFFLESNTLYRQVSPGQFSDATRRFKLRDSGFPMLGFGTQFLDANLDGWEDLVLTNGHIDDLTANGEPYQMPTQVLMNAGHGSYAEVSASKLGPFFQQRHLGRGLARADWNRDGLDDFAVSHLKEPAALLLNTTYDAGSFLAVRLRGTQRSRDAIGTTVEVSVGGRKLIKQLTAGDGYQASNERIVRFGLGPSQVVQTLTVRWAGGGIQSWENIDAGQTLLLTEGSNRYWTLVRP